MCQTGCWIMFALGLLTFRVKSVLRLCNYVGSISSPDNTSIIYKNKNKITTKNMILCVNTYKQQIRHMIKINNSRVLK